jgi:hypothetical protein
MRASTLATLTLILLVSILSFQQFQVAHADTVPLEDKALAYVENVLPFNMTYYTITVGSAYSLPSAPNDPTITQAVDIDLKSGSSTIHVVCVYVNGALHQCGVSPTGTPVSDRTYASVKDIAARILQAHQEQTGLDSTNLLNALNLVNDTKATKVTSGDVCLSVSQFPDIVGLQTINGMPVPVPSNSSFSVTFDWTLSQNGITKSQVTLSFDNGVFYDLQDERGTQSIANVPATAADQVNSTSLTTLPQLVNGTSAKTNQSPHESLTAQEKVNLQNRLVVPILIAALAACVITVLAVVTHKSKNEAYKN